MSAFVVDKPHIDALVRAGLVYSRDGIRWRHQDRIHQLDHTTADAVGQMLVNQNVQSVRYRYNDDGDNLPGPIEPYWTEPYRWPVSGRNPSPVEALKLLDCYEYQSCETLLLLEKPVLGGVQT